MLKRLFWVFIGAVIAVALIRGVPKDMNDWGSWAETQMNDLSSFIKTEIIDKIDTSSLPKFSDLGTGSGTSGGDSGSGQ